MNFVKVESSQIAEVGFGDGLYGPETLALRFPPNKKQLAAGEPGSEYHYANVSAREYQALMAAKSIGSYFGQNIKSKPDLYPFTKVGLDPSQAVMTVGASIQSETTSAQNMNEPDGMDKASPSTALTVIDTMADDLLFTPGAVTDAMILAGREWYLAEAKKYDISTEKARTELKRFARPLQKLRTGIEARAKELTGATKRKIAAIDAEKRRLVMLVGGIEQEVLQRLTDYEAAEDARIEVRNAALKEIQDAGTFTQANWMNLPLDAMRDRLKEIESDTRQWPELGELSAKYREESIKQIKAAISAREEYESAQAELEKLRAEKAERDEADRQAEAKRKEDERIAAAVEAAKQAARQEVIAELKSPVASEAEDSPELAQSVQPFIYPEAPILFSAQTHTYIGKCEDSHMRDVHAAIVEALMGCALTRHEALAVVQAIVDWRIPHVSIQY